MKLNKYMLIFIQTNISKKNIDDTILLIPGVLGDIILTKKFFTSNADIKPFIELRLDQVYKDYLFSSRTALYARSVKDILKKNDSSSKYFDKDELVRISKGIQDYIKSESEFSDLKGSTSSADKNISRGNEAINEWRSIIESDSSDE